jgi:hypothetical protein
MAAPSVPRYDSMTRGSASTSSGGPSAITRPWSMAISRSATELISGMSCSTTTRLAPISSRRRRSSGTSASASRWAIPDDGSSSRITVGRWATWQARSTTRRVPVDNSRTNELAVPLEAHEPDEVVDHASRPAPRRRTPSAAAWLRRAHSCCRPTVRAPPPTSRHGELGEEAGILERAAQAAGEPARRPEVVTS